MMTVIRITGAVALIVAGAVALSVLSAEQPGVTRTELQRRDLGVPGREVVQVRVDLAPGIAFPSHTHPGEEIINVLEGTWEYVIDGKPVTARAGDALFVPAGVIHSAKNAGSGKASELATYIVEKGQPLLTLVK